jgi:hypothetical protein
VLRPHDFSAFTKQGESGFEVFVSTYKPLLPIPALLVALPLVWLAFRGTWRELDEEAHRARGEVLAAGRMDYRPFVALVLAAVVLTMHEYYGGKHFYDVVIRPLFEKLDLALSGAGGASKLNLTRYDDLWGFGWWAGTRVLLFAVVPFALWKRFFPADSLRDMGLRSKGIFLQTLVYALVLGVAVPVLWKLHRAPDFGDISPFFRPAGRSRAQFVAWDLMYFAQFFAVELFFRGWSVGALRKSLGSGAIFCMAVPYCMSQYGGSYFRSFGAIVIAIVLASLSLRTKSIYRGLVLHVVLTGALGWLALSSATLYGYASLGVSHAVKGFDAFLATFKPLIPIPSLLVILPIVWLFFRNTWRELDEDAYRARSEALATGKTDYRPFVALVIAAVVLTMQEYYGGRIFFDTAVRPWLGKCDAAHDGALKLAKYDELYGFAWWSGTRIAGYTIIPFSLWKIIFRRDSLLDLGLRTKGFWKHAWIYGLFLAVVLPAMYIVSREPDFGTYYPFYKNSSRSWADFLMWEAMYFAQFFALEMFFRGWWLGVLRRSFGSGAIFCMAVPYCMIHYGKPYLEANGAIVAGIALGSLSMKTKSIYQGFMVHITVAALMDWLALSHRHALPTILWAPN